VPLTEANLRPDAATNKLGVVAGVSTSGTATVITVVNLAKGVNGVAKVVDITLADLRPAKRVRTAMKKPVGVADGQPVVTLAELDEADVIVIEH
jgi:hypothetical protein